MMTGIIRIVQITDTHLYTDPGKRLLGLATQASFAAVLQAVQKQSLHPDMLLLTGDLSQDESLPAYQRLSKEIALLKTPTYWIPGNHDDVLLLQQGLSSSQVHSDKSIIKNNWQIILLNSHQPKKVEGYLDENELHFLETQLKKYPQHHTLICLHHHPMAVGSQWLDKLGLQNNAAFFEIIDRYPQVRALLNGHIHQEFAGFHKKIPVWATPSTCIQFKPKCKNFTLDIISPGYRYLELHADGTIDTKVYRATQFTEYTDADINSKGY